MIVDHAILWQEEADMRFFNTEGPVNCADHYCLPPLSRLDMEDVLTLIAQKKYFLLHAPRQTGKTTCLLALADYLNERDEYYAVYANIETAQAARENVAMGMADVTWKIALAASRQLHNEQTAPLAESLIATIPPTALVETFLARWCAQLDKPLVLLLDEVDALVGDTLISLLRQLRAGYPNRPQQFPQTVMLCGVRDIQDYRIQAAEGKATNAVYNINSTSIRLGDFTATEVNRLLEQYAVEAGRTFAPDASDLLWSLTQGQPWLVNALAARVVADSADETGRRQQVSAAAVVRAKDYLIEQPPSPLASLLAELDRPNVYRIVEVLLQGGQLPWNLVFDDITYVRDVGLVPPSGSLAMANPIYAELIQRALAISV